MYPKINDSMRWRRRYPLKEILSKPIGQWVRLSFAIFAIFDLKRQLKLLEMACDQVQTCLIFPLRWASFPIKISRNAQWEHLFRCISMIFRPFTLFFSLKVHFLWENRISLGTPYTCDYFRWRDSMPFDQDIIVLFR